MKKLIDSNTYPVNVLRVVFGDTAEKTSSYVDEAELNSTIDKIVEISLTDDARSIFYSLYKERLSEGDVTKKYGYTIQKLREVNSLILRELRRPRNASLLKKYSESFRVVPIENNALSSQLVNEMPIMLTEHSEAKAVVMSIELYNMLIARS